MHAATLHGLDDQRLLSWGLITSDREKLSAEKEQFAHARPRSLAPGEAICAHLPATPGTRCQKLVMLCMSISGDGRGKVEGDKIFMQRNHSLSPKHKKLRVVHKM
eukprot:193197-Pelagomonas_calceolata.AAC.1